MNCRVGHENRSGKSRIFNRRGVTLRRRARVAELRIQPQYMAWPVILPLCAAGAAHLFARRAIGCEPDYDGGVMPYPHLWQNALVFAALGLAVWSFVLTWILPLTPQPGQPLITRKRIGEWLVTIVLLGFYVSLVSPKLLGWYVLAVAFSGWWYARHRRRFGTIIRARSWPASDPTLPSGRAQLGIRGRGATALPATTAPASGEESTGSSGPEPPGGQSRNGVRE